MFAKTEILTSDQVRRPVRDPSRRSDSRAGVGRFLNEVRGLVMFALDNEGAVRDRYIEGHSALKDRVFATVTPEHPAAAWFKVNDPVNDFDKIQRPGRGWFPRSHPGGRRHAPGPLRRRHPARQGLLERGPVYRHRLSRARSAVFRLFRAVSWRASCSVQPDERRPRLERDRPGEWQVGARIKVKQLCRQRVSPFLTRMIAKYSERLHQLGGRLVAGMAEPPPRLVAIRTAKSRARRVETVANQLVLLPLCQKVRLPPPRLQPPPNAA